MVDVDARDSAILRRLLETAGRWILFIHQGHIVKVARVTPEQPAGELLDNLPPSESLTVAKSTAII